METGHTYGERTLRVFSADACEERLVIVDRSIKSVLVDDAEMLDVLKQIMTTTLLAAEHKRRVYDED